ncbi:hypothetical protein COCMIDRAFT_110783, partial [Bipolaris oryzae ATCC 44560]
GEECIRPRKRTLYSVQGRHDGFSLQEPGLSGIPNTSPRRFRDWDLADARSAPKPKLDIALHELEERHLILHTE